MVIKQVVDFAAINFVHWNGDGEISLIVLPVIDSSLKQILHCIVLQTLHGESLARASLPVRKNCYRSRVENQVEDRLDTEAVKFLVRLMLAKRVVEFESLVVNKFCDAIHLVLAVMDDHFRVGNWNYVNFTTC